MEYFTYKDLKIFYKNVGSGKPIIFLHNGGNSHIIWNHQLGYFSGSHTCYAFNRGYRDPEFITELKENYSRRGQLGALIDILADIESFTPMDNFEIPQKFPETLVIWGEKNSVLPLKAGQKLCAKLKPHRFEVIKGGGHVVMHELHQEVNALIDKFIGG